MKRCGYESLVENRLLPDVCHSLLKVCPNEGGVVRLC